MGPRDAPRPDIGQRWKPADTVNGSADADGSFWDAAAAPHLRGSGVGAMLMDAVLKHPRVAGVKSIELVCQPELMPFYRRWGFTDQVGQSRLMRRTDDPSLLARS